jgi:hypothetical protein
MPFWTTSRTPSTYDEAGSGLDALTAVAALQKHLAADVVIERGKSLRVRFFDARIARADDASVTVSVTAEVMTRGDSGEDVVDVHQVVATLTTPLDRWVVTTARTVPDREPDS